MLLDTVGLELSNLFTKVRTNVPNVYTYVVRTRTSNHKPKEAERRQQKQQQHHGKFL